MQTTLPKALDNTLLQNLSQLLKRHNHAIVELLIHLGEVDHRRLFAPLGYASMFSYCTDKLKMSESATYRRLRVARAGREFPLIIDLIEQGRLHLTGAASVAPHLTLENHVGLLKACCGLNKRDLSERLADLAPKPDVKPSVRLIPTHSDPAAQVEIGDAQDTATAKSPRQAPTKKHRASPPSPPLGQSRYAVKFTAPKSFVAKLDKARALLAHRVSGGDTAEILERALVVLIEQVEKDRFAMGAKPRKARAATPKATKAAAPKTAKTTAVRAAKLTKRSRHIPNGIKRAVYKRDLGRCAFVAEDGHRCSATRLLEFHHIRAWAVGGKHSVENIEVRCHAHNRLAAEEEFGVEFVARKQRARDRLSQQPRRVDTGVGVHGPPAVAGDCEPHVELGG